MQLLIHEEHQLDLFDPNQQDIYFPLPLNREQEIDEIFNKLVFLDGRKPRRFQAENIWFIDQEANGRGIIADDTGLGKTISVCGLIKMFPLKYLPALVICKTTLKSQWWVELYSTNEIIAQIIKSSADLELINEDAKVWIISYDMFKRIPDLKDYIRPQLVVMDECQLIKNVASARTNAVVDYIRAVEAPYIVPTSATPIKNNSVEFHPTLNLLHPKTFYAPSVMESLSELIPTNTGWKHGGIAAHYEKLWQELTRNIIIRHRREEVAPELPPVLRTHRFVKIEDPSAVGALVNELKRMVDYKDKADLEDKQFDDEGNPITRQQLRHKARASLMKVRRIIGEAKIPFAVDYIEEFFRDNPDKRLTVFVHHKSVAEGIINGVGNLMARGTIDIAPPYILRGGMSPDERDRLVAACTRNHGWPTDDPRNKLLIASTLAAGEGINLQKCYDAMMVERQFNPPNEEQAIGGDSGGGRFSRLGISADVVNIFVTFLTALQSVDEWFHRHVEQKRIGNRRTMGDTDIKDDPWSGLSDEDIAEDLLDTMAEEARRFIKQNVIPFRKKARKSA